MINKANIIDIIDIIDSGLILTGLGISLVDIQNILSIIILIIDMLWILIKFIVKFFKYFGDGKLTNEEIKDLENDLKNITGKDGDKNE